MSSLPSEILVDALRPLDRWTLDAIQFTNRRFPGLIMQRMSGVCLREVNTACFSSEDGHSWVDAVGPPERQDGLRHEESLNANVDFAAFLSAFLHALWSSRVNYLYIYGATARCLDIKFTPALARLLLESPITAHDFTFGSVSFTDLTPTVFHALVLHFSPSKLDFEQSLTMPPLLLARQLTDDFLRALTKNRVRQAFFPELEPLDDCSFYVTDDAIVDFCAPPDGAAEQDVDDNELEHYADLHVSNGLFTKDLFKRLVEASTVSTRTKPLRIVVEPVRFADKDLSDFAQHLSRRHGGQRGELRIYDFPDEQRGEIAATDLQITLQSERDALILVRARRPNPHFK